MSDALFPDLVETDTLPSREALGRVLYEYLSAMTLEEFVRSSINPVSAAIHYVRLCAGHGTGADISLLFTPHRLAAKTNTSSQSVWSAMHSPHWCSGLARAVLSEAARNAPIGSLLYRTLRLNIDGVQYVNEFRPDIARSVCLRYGLTRDSSVLDPCAGWGGRLIGVSTVAGRYVGVDPSRLTCDGLSRLSAFLRPLSPRFTSRVDCVPFEDWHSEELFDLAVTSPPYYDTEYYSDDPTDSARRYSTFEEWDAKFFRVLFENTLSHLTPDGVFICNVGDRQYPLSQCLKHHCHALGATVTQTDVWKMSGRGGLRHASGGERFFEIRP